MVHEPPGILEYSTETFSMNIVLPPGIDHYPLVYTEGCLIIPGGICSYPDRIYTTSRDGYINKELEQFIAIHSMLRIKDSLSRLSTQELSLKDSDSRTLQGLSLKDSDSRTLSQGLRLKNSLSRTRTQGLSLKDSL